ncbi:MAG: peptidoglycan-binding protein [Anaerolineales bacterium]
MKRFLGLMMVLGLMATFAILLFACAPNGAVADAQATNIALSVQLTLLAQASEEVAATEIPIEVTATNTSVPTNTSQPTATVEPIATDEPTDEPFEVPDWPLFRQGDEGPEVFAIQHLLRSHGYNLAVDGNFGPQTRQQVHAFQVDEGLGADGIVGPQTWGALIDTELLNQGDSGQAVRALQVLLRDKFGYNQVNVDGDFGPLTRSAVEDFQDEYDLDVDGIVGPETWQALVAIVP